MNMDHLFLDAKTVSDLMTPNPVSIPDTTPLRAAAAILSRREISAVAVINDAGRPVGVLSRADIVRHDGGTAEPAETRKVMTATVVSIPVEAPAWEAVAKMAAFKVHRLFVVDASGVLVGVISAFDVVRKLRREK
jgi:CBS domain-containing protein